ncbi:MAG: hypothetical protein U5K73_09675 [Halofilum sp. (in: g-proteobacteria)]|nr:hypothetical protein [Halofilum sp. (in: g-proteobacteria)]
MSAEAATSTTTPSARRWLPVAVAGLVLAAILIAVPHGLTFSQQEILFFLVLNVLMVVSYRLVTLTGEWSLIHVVMQGVGAYAAALFARSWACRCR